MITRCRRSTLTLMVPIAFVIAGQDQPGLAKIGLWFAVLVAAVLILGVVVYILRWMALSKSDKHRTGFTIEQIDRLHNEGVLTEEEYRLARRSALGLTDPDAPE